MQRFDIRTFEVDFAPECMGELIVLARPLQAEKVVLFEMLTKPRVVAVIEAF